MDIVEKSLLFICEKHGDTLDDDRDSKDGSDL